LLDLTDAFAAAAIDGTKWVDALRMLADATGSARGQLIGIGGPSTVPFNIVNDIPEKALREFVEIGGGDPEINPRVLSSLGAPLLKVLSERDYRAAIPRLRSSIYLDYCRQYDIPHGCQTTLFDDGDGLIGLALLRTERDGPTKPKQRELFARIAPHVRSAVHVQRMIEADGAKLVAGTMEAMALAAFICDGHGLITQFTPAAEELLRQGRLRIDGKRLGARSKADTEGIRGAIQRACQSEPANPMESLAVRENSQQTALVIDVVSLPRRPVNLGFAPGALVIARSGSRNDIVSAQLIATAYGLSTAEAEISVRLARGHSRLQIAVTRGVTLGTIRSQIKSIFQKLDISREAELRARIAQLL
jgi:DNA-binding CsgD family transcriptional regulator